MIGTGAWGSQEREGIKAVGTEAVEWARVGAGTGRSLWPPTNPPAAGGCSMPSRPGHCRAGRGAEDSASRPLTSQGFRVP